MIQLSFNFDDVDAAIAFLGRVEKTPAAVQETPAPAKKRGRAAKASAPGADGVVPSPEQSGKPTAPGADSPRVSLDTVQSKLEAVFDKLGIESTRGLLMRFGAAKLSDLSSDRYEAFVAKADQVLAGEPI